MGKLGGISPLMHPFTTTLASWVFQMLRKNLPRVPQGNILDLIMKNQQGGKVMYAPTFKTRTTCNHKPNAKIFQPGCWRQSSDEVGEVSTWVTSWAEACCPCPATPHELSSTSCWCWLLPLSAGPSPNPLRLLHFRQPSQADYTTNDEELLYLS